jgi:hypothetical protein
MTRGSTFLPFWHPRKRTLNHDAHGCVLFSHTPSKITIPAVKISGSSVLRKAVTTATTTAPSVPLLDEATLCPDPCLSLAPLDTTLFVMDDDDDDVDQALTAAAILSSTPGEEESEFGEFLLDAVDWL